ncbi:hypothetical protein N9N67_03515 [Bacteriovoracaceae bacterium]|nr:hypothetical protein [Bacteriovoracaceae bacterium]
MQHRETERKSQPNYLKQSQSDLQVNEDQIDKLIVSKESLFKQKLKVPILFYYQMAFNRYALWKKLFYFVADEIIEKLILLKNKLGHSAKIESIMISFISRSSKSAEIEIILEMKEYFTQEDVQIFLSEGLKAKLIEQSDRIKKYKLTRHFKVKE